MLVPKLAAWALNGACSRLQILYLSMLCQKQSSSIIKLKTGNFVLGIDLKLIALKYEIGVLVNSKTHLKDVFIAFS
ncbi:MAG: hypothetical protein OFPII_11100 [Osedax symbiont Rs1]|nr:MAG: hypothetical protein OFPII_11100 [Osedax symbiont Rs1]